MLIFLILIPLIYICLKLILFFIVCKFGKFSYKGFSAAGFCYDSKNDMFYATKNAWQKNFGYSHTYDVLAPLFRMIIDTEPIRFYYNNKNYLITFWKGQYGIVTGAEIGIYATCDLYPNKKTLYLPVSEEDMLEMKVIVYKNGKKIMQAKATHWWLAIFKLGMFSKPKELSMDIQLKFPNKDMLSAFIIGFKKLKYKDKDYKIDNCTFIFHYKKPKTPKVWTRSFLVEKINQAFNKRNVKLYNKYILDLIDNNDQDCVNCCNSNVIKVQDLIPEIFKNNPDACDNIEYIAKTMLTENNVLLLKEDVYPYKKVDNE